jgi:hypothetical protein
MEKRPFSIFAALAWIIVSRNRRMCYNPKGNEIGPEFFAHPAESFTPRQPRRPGPSEFV